MKVFIMLLLFSTFNIYSDELKFSEQDRKDLEEYKKLAFKNRLCTIIQILNKEKFLANIQGLGDRIVYHSTSGYADGDRITLYLIQEGTEQYTTVVGALRTLHVMRGMNKEEENVQIKGIKAEFKLEKIEFYKRRAVYNKFLKVYPKLKDRLVSRKAPKKDFDLLEDVKAKIEKFPKKYTTDFEFVLSKKHFEEIEALVDYLEIEAKQTK